MSDNNEEGSIAQDTSTGQSARTWSLTNLQTRFPRSAVDMAQELLPNLPRHIFSRNSATPVRATTLPTAFAMTSPPEHGSVVVDLSEMEARDGPQEVAGTINSQTLMQMEEIRNLLRQMSNQRQQQHGHSHQISSEGATHAHGHSHDGQQRMPEEPHIDFRTLLKSLQSSGLFIVLLLLRFIYDHCLGLIVMLAMGGTFYFVNTKLTHCIHQTAVRETGSGRWLTVAYPLWLILFLAANIALLYYSFQEQALWNTLIYQMPLVAEVDVWTLLWVVLLTDFVVKFATVAIKCCIFLIPTICTPHRYRGKFYMFVEKVSQLYRLTLPIIPWVHYLQDDQEIGRLFAIATVVIYVLIKVSSLWTSAVGVFKAVQRLSMQTSFGVKPRSEDLNQRGTTCPICQDEFKDPILLVCRHIFCENCVSVWFDREKTCPMCRAQITDNPQWQDGSTCPSLQWF